jgi:hypothetical protein
MQYMLTMLLNPNTIQSVNDKETSALLVRAVRPMQSIIGRGRARCTHGCGARQHESTFMHAAYHEYREGPLQSTNSYSDIYCGHRRGQCYRGESPATNHYERSFDDDCCKNSTHQALLSSCGLGGGESNTVNLWHK